MDGQPAKSLTTPAQFLKGVGPDRAKSLERIGLATARDILFFFPRDYLDLSERQPLSELSEDHAVSVLVEVVELEQRRTRTGKSMLGVLMRQGPDFVRALWFNQSYMKDKL